MLLGVAIISILMNSKQLKAFLPESSLPVEHSRVHKKQEYRNFHTRKYREHVLTETEKIC
jgi:hypothetical protein